MPRSFLDSLLNAIYASGMLFAINKGKKQLKMSGFFK